MTDDPDHILAWQRLNDTVTTSGRLTDANVTALADLGVRHVINLALTESPGALANEESLVVAQGMAYTHIPVPFGSPEECHYMAFRAALAGGAQPVHVHCIMNWRVSAFFYRLHRERGMAVTEARALMEQQWSPQNSDHADAAVWAAFIAEDHF